MPRLKLTNAELRSTPLDVVVTSMPPVTVDPPVGGATSAKQDTGNASLASVDGKLPALVGGRVPVVLPAGGGGLTDTELRATAVPVSGTFYPVTQPVSGTFWQATQPVSGTFWQATQPVSGTLTVNVGLTDAQLRAVAVPVSGTFWQATQPVSAASLPLPSGASTETTLSSLNGKVTACNTGAVVVSAITPPTLTKATQGATGFSTQDLKDAGRVLKTYTASALTAVTSEALITLTPYADLSAGGGATTFAVTSGKRLRIQSITVTVRATSTVSVGGIVRLRFLAGAVQAASPVHGSLGCMASPLATAAAGNAQSFAMVIPDGLELSGTMQFGLTQLFSATSATIDVQVIGYEY